MKPEAHIAFALAGVAVRAATAYSGGVLRSSRLALSPKGRFRNGRLVAWKKEML
jgi:hypothetical protein